MFLHMKHHATRKDSSASQYQVRVPRDVAKIVRGRKIVLDLPASASEPAIPGVSFTLGVHAKLSMRTTDKATGEIRWLAISTHLARVYDAARKGVTVLSQRQVVGLSKAVYDRLRQNHHDNPGTPEQWAVWKAFTRAALEGRLPSGEAPEMRWKPNQEEEAARVEIFGHGDLTTSVDRVEPRTYDETALMERCGRLTLWVLQENGIEPDGPSHLALLREVARAALQAGWQIKREAQGDYRPDPMEHRFPVDQPRGISLTEIFDRWKAERRPAASTIRTWRGVVASLIKHVGHDDAARITDRDIVAWKDKRIATPPPKTGRLPDPKTVNAGDLACIRRLYTYAADNRILTANPVQGTKAAKVGKVGKQRLPYTNADIAALLAHAEGETVPHRRWLPILLATTGARVGELTQLWADRVCVEDGVVVLRIEAAADGGALKNEGSERTIPAHPALLASGFLEFARGKEGPLFYNIGPRRGARLKADSRHVSYSITNVFGQWVRTLPGFDDPRKAPAHSTRHWWKSVAVRACIADSVANHIQGHAEGSVAAVYRHHDDLRFLAGEIAKIPVPVPSFKKDDVVRTAVCPAQDGQPVGEESR